MKTRTSQAGLTLVELTIASAILSALLLVITTLFLNLVRQERSAVSVRDATQSVRYALDDITREARLSRDVRTVTGSPAGFDQICLYQAATTIQYYVRTTGSGTGLRRYLYKSTGQGGNPGVPCTAIISPGANDVSVVAGNLDVVAFGAMADAAAPYPVLNLRLGLTGDLESVISSASGSVCKAERTNVCAITTMETSISLRSSE